MTAGLVLDRVGVRLGGRAVVRDASLVLAAGTLTAIVGPNGAGKTSLLRAIAGLVSCEGTVRHDGDLLSALPPRARARRVAYLPQGHEVHWPLPGRAVVALGRLPHGAGDPDRLSPADARAVESALAAADAAHLADRPVTAMSGGERARVALARVLAVEAPVVLADEPTAALDPRHLLDVARILRDLARAGRTVVAVTHDLGLAARFADRVAVMDGGTIAAEGPPEDALAPDILARVFGVRAFAARHDGEAVLVPWC